MGPKRIKLLTGIVGAAIMILFISSGRIFVNIGVALSSFVALIEIYTAVGLSKKWPLMILGFLTSIGFTFGALLKTYYLPNLPETIYMAPILFGYIFLLFLYYIIFHKTATLGEVSKMFFLTIFVCYFFANIVYIREMPNGQFFIWFAFVGAWLTDGAAFITGTLFGRNKLCKDLSPKKTIEGAIGGILCTVAVFIAIAYGFSWQWDFEINYFLVAIFGAICGVFAELGDLAGSAIKREHNIKDFGNFIPEHGGIMDRCDSLLFVAPAAYMFLLLFGSMMWR